MDNLYFGEIIRIRREELNMKQEELCEGVCERSTLSKIERGKNECSKYLAEVFLQRLGLPMDFYYASHSKKAIGQVKIKNDLTIALRTNNDYALPELIKEGEQYLDENIIYRQLIMRAKATILYNDGNISEAQNMLWKAICLVHKDFSFEKIEKMFLSLEDIYILNLSALIYTEQKDYETGLKIYKALIDNITTKKENDNSFEVINIKVMLYYNYSRALGRADYYRECLLYAEKGLELNRNTNRIMQQAELLMNKGYSLCSIHGRKEEGILVLKDALKLCEVIQHHRYIDIIKRDAKQLFGVIL